MADAILVVEDVMAVAVPLAKTISLAMAVVVLPADPAGSHVFLVESISSKT